MNFNPHFPWFLSTVRYGLGGLCMIQANVCSKSGPGSPELLVWFLKQRLVFRYTLIIYSFISWCWAFIWALSTLELWMCPYTVYMNSVGYKAIICNVLMNSLFQNGCATFTLLSVVLVFGLHQLSAYSWLCIQFKAIIICIHYYSLRYLEDCMVLRINPKLAVCKVSTLNCCSIPPAPLSMVF